MKLIRSEKSHNELVDVGKEVIYPNIIKTVSDEECEKYFDRDDTVLICATDPLGGFEYDETICKECGVKIFYRPYNKHFKNKICVECASKLDAGLTDE